MGLGNWALFIGATMLKAYWNFERVLGSSYIDIINNTDLIGTYSGEPFNLKPTRSIRNSGALIPGNTNSPLVPYNGTNLWMHETTGNPAQLKWSGDFSMLFWYAGSENGKWFGITNSNSDYRTNFIIDKSGTTRQFDINIDWSGNIIFRTGNDIVTATGIDVGRWNMFYFEHDNSNNRLGISINAQNKIFSAHTGVINNQDGNIRIYQNSGYLSNGYGPANYNINNYANFDEFAIRDEILSVEKLQEYYHNFHAFSYSGDMRSQYLYPQRDIYSNNSFYTNRTDFLAVPSGRRWEYINEDEYNPYLGHDTLYAENVDQVVTAKFGTGKLFVKPSSCIYRIACGNAHDNGFSGVVKNVKLYDKQNLVIGSSTQEHLILESNFSYSTSAGYLSINLNNNFDLDDTYIEFTYDGVNPSGQSNYPHIAQFNMLVSGQPIFETGLPLYESGGQVGYGYLDLYENGYANQSGSLDLYTAGHIAQDSGLPLYTFGTYIHNSSLPLYMRGYSTFSSGIDLYSIGYEASSGAIPLFIAGHEESVSTMPLFTKNVPIEQTGQFTLFTYGSSGDPLVFGGSPLYLEGNDNLSTYSTMPLFIKVPLSGVKYESLPLFLDSNTRVASSVDLFLKNEYIESGRLLRLFIQGEGSLDGGLPYTTNMPLYIERIEGSERGLSMFLKANDGINSGFPLYMLGGTYAASGLDLYTTSYDRPSGLLKLYTCGY